MTTNLHIASSFLVLHRFKMHRIFSPRLQNTRNWAHMTLICPKVNLSPLIAIGPSQKTMAYDFTLFFLKGGIITQESMP